MHNFMDARDVAPAWELLQRGRDERRAAIRATQERLQACSLHMAHPESDELVPACVQHSVLDPIENRELVTLLAAPRRRPPSTTEVSTDPTGTRFGRLVALGHHVRSMLDRDCHRRVVKSG